MQNQVRDLVAESVVAEFLSRIAHDKKASLRMNPARPRLELSGTLELLPILRFLENVDVRFDVCRRGDLLALQFFRYDAVMKLGFHRNRGHDEAIDEMINEMFGLSVLPLFRMNGQRLGAELIRIALAQAGEFNFGERVQTRCGRLGGERKRSDEK